MFTVDRRHASLLLRTVAVLKPDLLHKTLSTPNISCSWKRHSAGVKSWKGVSTPWTLHKSKLNEPVAMASVIAMNVVNDT